MLPHELSAVRDFAASIAVAAAEHILPHFAQPGLQVEAKADASPVTCADRAAEAFLREAIARRFPDHGIIGEEFVPHNPDARITWILDPIDGTKAFISGVPLFTTLIGVRIDGQPRIGVIYQPVTRQLMLGDGQTTTLNGQRVRGPKACPLEAATLLTTDSRNPLLFQNGARWDHLVSAVKLYRSWGDAYGYLLVAAGLAHAMTDPILEVWDVAALLPILVGAGLRATQWDGSPVPTARCSLIAAPAPLHDAILAKLYTTT